MKKRIVSMVLAAAVAGSSISTAALAAEYDLTEEQLIEIVAEESYEESGTGLNTENVQEDFITAEEASDILDEDIILDLDSESDTQEIFDVDEEETQTEAETAADAASEEVSDEEILSEQEFIAEDFIIEEIAEADEEELSALAFDADETDEKAEENTEENTETVYALMNIPYAIFYQQLNNGTAVDGVSSATAQKSAGCKNVYFGETPAIDGGTEILGIAFPVKMDSDVYELLKENTGLTEHSDYYLGSRLSEEPSVYMSVSYADGAYTFSSVNGEVQNWKNVDATITSNTSWGDYQVNLTNSEYGVAPAEVYGIYLTTTDGSQYALRQGENLWTPGNYYEFAWSTGVQTAEPHGTPLKSAHYASMEGKTIQTITYITTDGILNYQLSSGLYVAPHDKSEERTASAALTGVRTVSLSGLPSDIEDARVSVYTQDPNNRKKKIYLAENAEVSDGAAALTTAPEYGTEYTVVVESNNYAAITAAFKAEFEYVLMNVPYADFYQVLNNNTAVDSVSSATAQKSAGCSNVYFGATPSIENGTEILGIVIPVKITKEIYDTYKGKENVTDDYYISTVFAETPNVYLDLTGESSKLVGQTNTTDNVKATITSNTSWGDYQVNLADDSLGVAPSAVYGIYLTTTDGSQYALRQGENLWTPRSYYEFAWSTGVKTSEPHGSALKSAHYSSMEGKTIESITYITTTGIHTYNLETGLYVAPHYNSEDSRTSVSAAFDDDNTVSVANLPADISDAKVSVYTGGRQKTYLAENAELSNGTVTLTQAPVFGTEYTVAVESSNYATLTTTVSKSEGYVLMNIPYSVFYEQLNNTTAVDTVSSATAQKSAGCSNVYFGSVPTIENGTEILGVVFPVQISAAAYTSLKASVTSNTADYYISSVLTEKPAVYMKVKAINGSCSFSSILGTKTTMNNVSATITSNTTWGDYQVNLADDSQGVAPADVYGIYLTTRDGSQYALRQGENLWTPRSYYEFAWSTGVKTSEPHGSALKSGHYKTMEGKTITSITYITTSGIRTYNLAAGLYVAPHYNGTISAELIDADTVSITGLPSDISEAKVSVYTGGKQKTYLAENAALSENGTVALTAAAAADTEYTVAVESSNYAALTATVKLNVVETEAPAEPDESETTTPVEPDESETTTTPTTPDNSGTTTTPAEPDNSGSTTTPTEPDESETTTTPAEPDNSGSTTTPTEPDESETTTTPAEPDNSGSTATPVQPDNSATDVTVKTSVKVNKKSMTICVGEKLDLTATLNPVESTDKVSWSSSDTAVAKVSSKGKVTALQAGTVTITAKLKNGNTASCKVTVKSAAADTNLTKKTLYLGKSFTWSTTLSRRQSGTTLTFQSSDTSVASVDKNGKITALQSGTATITGQTSSGRSLTCKVTVKEVKATSVKLNVTKKTLTVGKTYALKATVAPTNSTDQLTYSSSDAKVVKVSANGKLTALKKGTATITVKTTSGKKATCKVTVKEVKATSVKLNVTKKTLTVGKTYTLKATVAPTNSTDQLTYSSSNAKVVKVSTSGKLTALKKGTATITVKTTSGKKATCKVTVK